MGSLRTVLSWLLALAACGLTVVALAATWMHHQVLSTDRWTDTSVQVLRDPQVQELTAAFLADQLIAQQDAVREALPDAVRPFAGAATLVVGEAARQAALDALRAGALESLWADASRSTHEQFVRWLRGLDQRRSGDVVTLDLQPAIERLAARAGIPSAVVDEASRLTGGAKVALIQAGEFDRTRRDAHRLEQAASLTLPLAVVAAVLSILVARRRRTAIARIGLAVAAAGGIVLLAQPALRDHLQTGLIAGGAAQPVADAILDLTIPELLRAAWLAVVGGAAVALLAAVARPLRTSSATVRS